MNKLELIQALRDSQNLSKSEAMKCVEIFFGEMAKVLEKGDRVEIRGLCSFHVKTYKPYTGRNPKSGKTVMVKPKKLPFFKVGTDLKKRVDR